MGHRLIRRVLEFTCITALAAYAASASANEAKFGDETPSGFTHRPLLLAQAGSSETLKPAATSDAPIPVPETADDVDYDGDEGKLEFNSASSVKAIADFYRSSMKPLGWHEQTSVINRPNMVVLNYSKDGKAMVLTIMQMGNQANVTAVGSGLNAAAKPITAEAAAAAAQKLEVDETGGYPVPKNHSMSGTEETPFRSGLTASVPIDLPTVLAFYRQELGKRGWKEAGPAPAPSPEAATVEFTSPNGPAVLKLTRENDQTSISLMTRKKDAAEKSGMLPKAGQAKIMFGNILPTAATVTINNKTINVAAGAGSKGPDGPSIEVPPGEYPFSAKAGGKPAKSDTVEVGADQIWGLMVGPGGVLAIQMY